MNAFWRSPDDVINSNQHHNAHDNVNAYTIYAPSTNFAAAL